MVGLGVLVAALSGCDRCQGREVSQTTYQATFVPTDGTSLMSSVLTVVDEDAAMYGPGGAWWTAAVQDAAGVTPAFGFVALVATDRALTLGLPFPLVAGQVLPLQASTQLGNDASFSFDPGENGVLPFPADAALALFGVTLVPPCTRAMPNACDADSQVQQAQTMEGTIEIVSASPLRLRVDATVSYPLDSDRTPVAVAGDVTFVVSDGGEICRGG